MLIVTTDGVAGYEIRSVLGEVLGLAVRADQGAVHAPGQGGSSATFRVTGEQPGAGLAAARREAVDRLGEEARRKGANTVVGMRFDTAVTGGGVEVCAYGTAVWAEPRPSSASRRPSTSSGRSTRGICPRTATRRPAARRWPRATSRWACTTAPAETPRAEAARRGMTHCPGPHLTC
ncbi:YbjQ family protein [Actinomadura luteofluorescens]|uniref:YbjQ family protein n=1 Tax=Actinomadura luteofluorescens TaxID=46163 RepID=UPI00362F74DB